MRIPPNHIYKHFPKSHVQNTHPEKCLEKWVHTRRHPQEAGGLSSGTRPSGAQVCDQ